MDRWELAAGYCYQAHAQIKLETRRHHTFDSLPQFVSELSAASQSDFSLWFQHGPYPMSSASTSSSGARSFFQRKHVPLVDNLVAYSPFRIGVRGIRRRRSLLDLYIHYVVLTSFRPSHPYPVPHQLPHTFGILSPPAVDPAAYKSPDLQATFPRGIRRSPVSLITIAWWKPRTTWPSRPSSICSVLDEVNIMDLTKQWQKVPLHVGYQYLPTQSVKYAKEER